MKAIAILFITKLGWDFFSKIAPIFLSQSAKLWKVAFPIAKDIIKDLADDGKFTDGLDKHKEAVIRLRAAILESSKYTIHELKTLDLQQIVLSAFADFIKLRDTKGK